MKMCAADKALRNGEKLITTTTPQERNRHGNNGEKNACAKLYPEAVRDIRSSKLTAKQLGAKYGVDTMTIRHVLYRNTWKSVPEESSDDLAFIKGE